MAKNKPKHPSFEPLNSLATAITFAVVFAMFVGLKFSTPTPNPVTVPPVRPPLVQAAPATAVAAPAVTPSPARLANSHTTKPNPTPEVATTTGAKYPGLPDYPHPQYEYTSLALPTGPLYTREGFLGRIDAAAGFDAATAAPTNPAVTVAVIDTGFALSHENLAGRWAANVAESGPAATDGLDNDNDGYIDNFRGWDFVHNSNNPSAGTDDPSGAAANHGTMTAGLASLLDPTDQILPLQALDDTGSGFTDDVAAAVHYAADHGAKIINLSLGSVSDDPYLHAQILYAIAKGSIVVAAAGNTGTGTMLYPAAYPEVLAVGASNSSDTRATISSYGPNLDILAPGTFGDVCSSHYTATNDFNAYTCSYSGTSLATPIVSGLAALLAGECPTCSAATVTAAILTGADPVAGMNGAPRTDSAGYGRINVLGAVTSLQQTPQNFVPGSAIAGDLDDNNYVNVRDLSMLLGQLGTSNAVADLNADGTVNFLDIDILLAHWTG